MLEDDCATEIDDFQDALWGDDTVIEFQIAMGDAQLVHVVYCVGQLFEETVHLCFV